MGGRHCNKLHGFSAAFHVINPTPQPTKTMTLQHVSARQVLPRYQPALLFTTQGGDADGAGLEVDRRLPREEGESDASDASEPAAGKHVLQRSGSQQPADAAPAGRNQQDSDDSSSEDEEVMPDSARRV